MSFSKQLTAQIIGESPRGLAYWQRGQPAAVKCVDSKPSFVADVHSACPQSAIILRHIDNSLGGQLTPDGGKRHADVMLRYATACNAEIVARGGKSVQFWCEGSNEVAANHANLENLKKLTVFEKAFAGHVQATGQHALVGNFGPGQPDIDDWPWFYDAMHVADGFAWHEYAMPKDPYNAWYLGRFLKWYPKLPAELRAKPAAITEGFIDGGLQGDGQSGYRKYPQLNYLTVLRTVDDLLRIHPKVVGFIFAIGGFGWSSYDPSGSLMETIAAEQEKAPMTSWGTRQELQPKPTDRPAIVDIVDKLPRNPNGPNGDYLTRRLSDIKAIAIHHSASPSDLPAAIIAHYHVEHNHWAGIGYHFYILGDGTIYQTNKLETISAHAFSVNAYAIGVCFAGDFTSAVPTDAQLTAGKQLVAWLMKQFKIPLARVRGHSEWADVDPRNATECPGKQWLGERNWKSLLLFGLEKNEGTNVQIAYPFHGSYVITQRFGENPNIYRQFFYNGVALNGHNGIDFGLPMGTPVLACEDGTVIEWGDAATDTTGFGNYIKLKHTWGESLYGHMQPVQVHMGQSFARGAQLGLSDNTGHSTGAHLHLQIRINPYNRADGWGGCVDPMPYLPASRGIELEKSSEGRCLPRIVNLKEEQG